MRFIELITGFSNPPSIDLDRIMSFQWFTEQQRVADVGGKYTTEEIGKMNIRFFGTDEDSEFRFKTLDAAKEAARDLRFLLNCKSPDELKKEQLEKLDGEKPVN